MRQTRIQQLLKLSLGVEDIKPGPEVTNLMDDPAPREFFSTEPTVPETEVFLIPAGEEVEAHEEAVEKLQVATESLGRIYLALEADIAAEGGISPQAATYLQEAIANIEMAVGEEPEEPEAPAEGETAPPAPITETVASNESFVGDYKVASLETLGKVKAQWDKFWAAIKTAIEGMIKAVKEYFTKYFTQLGRINEEATKIEKVANEVKEEHHSPGEIEVPGANLGVGGSVSAATIIQGLKDTKEIGLEVFTTYVDGAAKILKEAAESCGDFLKQSEGAGMSEVQGTHIDIHSSEIAKICHKEFSGGVVFSFGTDHTSQGLLSITAPELHHVEGHAGPTQHKITALTKHEILEICKEVKGIAYVIEEKKNGVEKLDAAAADFRKHLDTVLTSLDASIVEKTVHRVKVQAFMRVGSKPWTRPLTQYCTHTYGTMRAALGICQRSLGHHAVQAVTAAKEHDKATAMGALPA